MLNKLCTKLGRQINNFSTFEASLIKGRNTMILSVKKQILILKVSQKLKWSLEIAIEIPDDRRDLLNSMNERNISSKSSSDFDSLDHPSQRNKMWFPKQTRDCDRYGVLNTAGATIVTEALNDRRIIK